jgi:hypothetical protein
MRRVTRGRIVLLNFDRSHRPWLTDYLPEAIVSRDVTSVTRRGNISGLVKGAQRRLCGGRCRDRAAPFL